jgi:hypothetical protein
MSSSLASFGFKEFWRKIFLQNSFNPKEPVNYGKIATVINLPPFGLKEFQRKFRG